MALALPLLRAGANNLVQKPIEERLLVTKLLFQLRVALPNPDRVPATQINLGPSWRARVGDYRLTPPMQTLAEFLRQERATRWLVGWAGLGAD